MMKGTESQGSERMCNGVEAEARPGDHPDRVAHGPYLGRRARAFFLGVVGVLAVPTGCKGNAPPGETIASRETVLSIGAYASPPVGSVNNFWIETRDGVVVIDAQRVISEGRKSLAQIQALKKPILAIFLTHAHPDHYGGLSAFTAAAPDAPVYGSQTTHDIISSDALGFGRATAGPLGDDFPSQPIAPTKIVHDGERLEIDGVTVEVQELGAGEANAMTAIVLPAKGVAFVGDAISDRVTPALLQGMSLSWLGQLDVVEARLAGMSTLYLGHGSPGKPAELLQREREYLRTFRRLVAERVSPGGIVSPAGKAEVVAAMQIRYPDYPPVASLPNLLEVNVAATARELAGLGALLPLK
jgi:glyoxylase-like metal-dependent hydrolase (beta-lactamase superfamily II)